MPDAQSTRADRCSCSLQSSAVVDMRLPENHRLDCPQRLVAGITMPLPLVAKMEAGAEQRIAELEEALTVAEAALRRTQTHVGLLRQYDGELSMIVARAREKANAALRHVAAEGQKGEPR